MAEKLTKAQRQKNLAKAKEHIKNNKVVTVDRDAIIDIPVLGSFRDYIQETLNYILSSHNQKDVINVLAHIQNNFQDIKEDLVLQSLIHLYCNLQKIYSTLLHFY